MIEEIEKLQKDRGYEFSSDGEFEFWCDEIEPLLSLSPKHETEFVRAKNAAITCYRIGSYTDAYNNMSNAIGIVNRAVKYLKIQPKIQSEEVQPLQYPEKVTFEWLKQHVEIKHWFLIATLAAAIFSAGMVFGSSKFYQTYIFSSPAAQNGGGV